jgi:methionyl aminopeptidase
MIKTDEEVELMKLSNKLVTDTLAELAKIIQPGITTEYIDRIAEQYIRDNKGVPSFLGYCGFPKSICTSINDQVVHGIPSNVVLKDGDIVSVDCGTILNGWQGDCAYTFEVGEVAQEIKQLMKITKESLFLGGEKAIVGNRIGDIGYAVQFHAESNGYSVVREMVGHGLGRQMHERPEVPNYGKKGSGAKLVRNMTICIEPMINMGVKSIVQEKDGWTVHTSDRKPSAHFELPVAIRENAPVYLSNFNKIEEVLNQK